jgi:hypothetical protein
MKAKWNFLFIVKQTRPMSSAFPHGSSDLMLTKQRSSKPTGCSGLHGSSMPGALGGGGEGLVFSVNARTRDAGPGGEDGPSPPSINHPAGQVGSPAGVLRKAGTDEADEDIGICWSRARAWSRVGCWARPSP